MQIETFVVLLVSSAFLALLLKLVIDIIGQSETVNGSKTQTQQPKPVSTGAGAATASVKAAAPPQQAASVPKAVSKGLTPSQIADITAKLKEFEGTCGKKFLTTFIDKILIEVPKRLAALRQSFGQGERDEFQRSAHTLYSMTGQIGATYFADVAKKVELAAKDGRMNEMGDSVTWLEQQFVDLRAELEKLREA